MSRFVRHVSVDFFSTSQKNNRGDVHRLPPHPLTKRVKKHQNYVITAYTSRNFAPIKSQEKENQVKKELFREPAKKVPPLDTMNRRRACVFQVGIYLLLGKLSKPNPTKPNPTKPNPT